MSTTLSAEDGASPRLGSPSPLYQRFRSAAEAHPAKIALACAGRQHSFGELLRDSEALAAGLAAGGVRVGDHVGVLLPNAREFVLVLLAAARSGLVLVPQAMGLGPEAVANTFRAADVRHVIAWHGLIPQPPAGPPPWAAMAGGVRISVGAGVSGWTSLEEVFRAAGTVASALPDLPPDHPYLMVLTSGSTGAPKPILLSQDTKLKRALSAIALYGVSPSDVTLAATPLYHSLAQRLVLVPLLMGGTSVLMSHFTPAEWIAAVRQYGVSFSIAVSSQLKQLLPRLQSLEAPLDSLRCLVSSSALLDDATKSALFASLRCDFHECYGASEIAVATNLSPEDASRSMGSVGKAIPGADVKIVDERLSPVAAGTPGEIVCRTTLLHSGYYRQSEATQRSMWGEYFRTGDLGRMDGDGYLFFLGRIKDIIISGGVNIYPKDIEDVVAGHAAVRECAAIAVPDEALGEVVGMVVAFHEQAVPPDMRELQRLCMEKLGDYQQPRHFQVVEQLPKNAMGKIDKPALRRRFQP